MVLPSWDNMALPELPVEPLWAFFVPMKPRAWSEAWIGKAHRKRTTKTPQRNAMNTIACHGVLAKASAHHEMQTGPLALYISVHTPRRGVCRYDAQTPDDTNYQKLVEDALTGILWRDDAQIVRNVTSKAANTGHEGIAIMVFPVQREPPKGLHFAHSVTF